MRVRNFPIRVARALFVAVCLVGVNCRTVSAAPPVKVRLPASSSFTVQDGKGHTIYCGFSDGAYRAGKVNGEYFEPNSNLINKLKYQLRKAHKLGNSNSERSLRQKIKKKQKSSRKANSYCASGPGGDTSEGASMEVYSEPLTREDIRYLLEKAGFGASSKEEALISTGLTSGLDELITEFMSSVDEPLGLIDRVVDRMDGVLGSNLTHTPSGQRQGLLDLWTHTNNPYAEKFALFLLSIWTVSGDVISDETFRFEWWNYYSKLRSAAQASTNLPDLAVQLTRDPVMLIYLNNELNRKGNPNENFARELMELFTLGPTDLDGQPNYTESATDGGGDIAVAAQALTGWTVKLNYSTTSLDAEFKASYHEDGPHVMFKGTSYEFAAEDDEDVVRGIFEHHPGVSIYYATEILREYVTPRPSRGLVENFAAVIRANSFNLRAAMGTLFRSKAFFHSAYRNTVPKSPVEFAVEIIRTLGMADAFNYGEVGNQIGQMGMEVNNPPSVFWYNPQGWVSPAAILEKANFIHQIFGDSTAQGNSSPPWSAASILPTGALSPAELIAHCESLLGTAPLSNTQISNLEGYVTKVREYDGSYTNRSYDNTQISHQREKGLGMVYILAGLPSFQLK